ncbi:MAG: sensor histidine kinase [Aestuariivirgaceae bacterium]
MPGNSPATSTVFRLALVFAAVYSAAIIVTGAFIYFMTTGELEKRMRLGVEAEQARFMSISEGQGDGALEKEIERHADAIVAADAVYLLVDSDGRTVAGNIAPIKPFLGWSRLSDEQVKFVRPQSDDPDWFHLLGTKVGNYVLITGRSNEDVEEPQEIVLKSILWGVLAVLFIGLTGGLYFARSAQSRIDVIQSVLQRAAAGDLSARIDIAGHNDDIERVSISINDAIVRLESLVEGMQQISADIAHDLRTPIGRLRHKLEATRGKTKSVAAYRRAVDDTIREVDTIVATFEALLRIAQIGGGARKSRFKQVSLRHILTMIEEVYVPVAEDAGQQIVLQFHDTVDETVIGDQELLVQLFANIVENAIRHCPVGSKIDIKLSSGGGLVTASVADDGPGIPAADRQKVFRRFYRTEKSRTTPGNGLGLSLVSAIAELHDAELHLLDAEPGLRVDIIFKAAKN